MLTLASFSWAAFAGNIWWSLLMVLVGWILGQLVTIGTLRKLWKKGTGT